MTQDECSLEQYMHKMAHSLRSPYTVQAVRPTRHWWRCPRVLAWFRVLMVWSLVKPPASGGPLSRIGDYLCAARGPGLFLRIRKRTTLPPKSAVTRGPPHPLFHRRSRSQCYRAQVIRDQRISPPRWQPTGVSHKADAPVRLI